MDAFDLIEAVDILAKLPKDFYDNMVSEWAEKYQIVNKQNLNSCFISIHDIVNAYGYCQRHQHHIYKYQMVHTSILLSSNARRQLINNTMSDNPDIVHKFH